ncbi:unnamed protein product [Urochloa decumbens]|uniref:Pentatricopeptide repeat-containing protein n=1 Tax=Urochloa decumbens TaxID=240449 RepID=A0ABC8XTU1_9POAL
MSRRGGDRCLELERVIASRFRSGSLGLDAAANLFDELLPHARHASVRAFNLLLTAAASRAQGRGSSSTARHRLHVQPDGPCLPHQGISRPTNLHHHDRQLLVNTPVINRLLNGPCDAKRVGDAMDVLLRRMPEFGCKPDVLSYSMILKGFCNEKRVEEALDLLHMMADDGGGGSCPPDVVAYNTVITGFFREGQADKAYGLFLEMLDQGVLPTVVTYTTVIDGLCKARAVDRLRVSFRR